MEVDDNSHSSNQFDDSYQNQIVQQLLRTNISSKRKKSFWYDILNFPDALLTEILARLPVKSIFKFRSVCKHWLTLISHPSFFRFYYSILNSNVVSSGHFRILGDQIYVPSFREFINSLHPDIESPSEFSVLFLSLRRERYQYNEFRILDTSNGLILFQSGKSEQFVYYICDPLTRQWITLPRRKPRFRGVFVEGLSTRVSEDHMLTGYTVVRVELVESRMNYLKLEMLSSETGKWIAYNVRCTIPVRLEAQGGCAIHCYGALHWRVRNDNNGIHGILAFDPYQIPRSVHLIPFPSDRDHASEYRDGEVLQLCGECQGTLRYFEVSDPDNMADDDYLFSMWAMKDYEKGEWCCEFKVRRSELHTNNPKLSKWLLDGRWFMPLSFHPLNPNVVYLKCMKPECVVSYDVLNRRLDVACKPIDICEYISQFSVIPFMLPRWPLLVKDTKTEV